MSSDSSATWTRPSSIPFPSVWRRFSGRKKTADGKAIKFKVQDVTDDMHDELVQLMTEHFLRDEYTCATFKVLQDPVSVKECEGNWRKILKQRAALVAVVDEELPSGSRPRIAGANITGVTLKTDHFSYDMFEGKPLRSSIKFAFDYSVTPHVNVFEIYGVDAYMSALGLMVIPEFRGQGLAEEILKARFPLCKALGLKAMMTVFSPLAAQKAAEKAGMKVLHESFYEDYRENGKKVFINKISSPSLKVMACSVD